MKLKFKRYQRQNSVAFLEPGCLPFGYYRYFHQFLASYHECGGSHRLPLENLSML